MVNFLGVFVLLTTLVQGHKILVVVPMYGKSHWNYMKVFINELIYRGHELTCITSISMGKSKPYNYTEILIDPPFVMQNFTKPENIFKWSINSPLLLIIFATYAFSKSTEHALENELVQKFIHSDDLHFDLIVIEDISHDAFLMLGHKFKAPIVTICPFGIAENYDVEMGLQTPISHVSNTWAALPDKMSFGQRWYNAALTSIGWFMYNFFHIPWHTHFVNKHFPHLKPLPSIEQIRKNISIHFVNVHRSMTYPRPSMPGLVYIGGAHIKSPKPLPADLQTYLDESEYGVIYFSVGTMLTASAMPTEKLEAFLETFRQLKQRVIWKFEDENISNLPDNVLVRNWLPQTDILAHPNVVLIISHGGMFSNFEAVNYGVQMLMIPFSGDQFRNAFRAQTTGYAKVLDFHDLTLDLLLRTINEMLTDKKYSIRAEEVSAIFRDNLVHPMDEFVWWIEHVIKFRGANHLKSHAADMSLFTYLLLDVILLNLVIFSAVLCTIGYAIKQLCFKKKTIEYKLKKQ